jgi:hypothetical protein
VRDKPKTVRIETALTSGLRAMLAQMPQNPMIRSQVHAALQIAIPDSCQTWDQVREWIEYDYHDAYHAARAAAAKIPPAPATPATDAFLRLGGSDDDVPFNPVEEGDDALTPDIAREVIIDAPVQYTYNEVGIARYRVEQSGIGNYELNGETLRTIIQNAIEDGADYDEMLNLVRRELTDQASEDPPETSSNDDYAYDRHESNDTEGHDYVLTDRHSVNQAVLNFIRTHMPTARQHFEI